MYIGFSTLTTATDTAIMEKNGDFLEKFGNWFLLITFVIPKINRRVGQGVKTHPFHG